VLQVPSGNHPPHLMKHLWPGSSLQAINPLRNQFLTPWNLKIYIREVAKINVEEIRYLN